VRTYLFSILIIFWLSSCKVGSFGHDNGIFLPSQSLPGTIVVKQSKNFTEAGFPKLEEKIKLSIQKKLFTKNSIREYNKKVHQNEQKVEIIDSLELKPHHYKLEIADKIGLITALNHIENNNLRTYLQTTQKNLIITSVEVYFPSEVSVLIDKASEIYLVNNKSSSYSLELFNKDRTRSIIDFREGTSFGYGFSAFCWRENNRRQPEVAAFRKKGRSCPGNTEKNPDKFKSEDIFEKL
jgi:hypothetical protein